LEFFVAGVNNEMLVEAVKKNLFIDEYTMEPRILTKLLSERRWSPTHKPSRQAPTSLEQTGSSQSLIFMFPFGFTATKIDDEEFPGVLDHFMANNRSTANANFYVFCLNSNENNMNNLDGKDTMLSNANPNMFHYYYVAQYEELHAIYLDDDPDSQFCIYKSQRVLCMKTYFPFHDFYFSILSKILEQMRSRKNDELSEMMANYENSLKELNRIDGEFGLGTLELEIFPVLEQLLNHKLDNNLTSYEEIGNEMIGYDILNMTAFGFNLSVPNYGDLKFCEAIYGIGTFLNDLAFEDFLFILVSILLERTIVFVCEDMSILSSFMMTFTSLIKPFQWPFPIIYSLPESSKELLGSPIPIIVGICES
jgi:hypothetical protein